METMRQEALIGEFQRHLLSKQIPQPAHTTPTTTPSCRNVSIAAIHHLLAPGTRLRFPIRHFIKNWRHLLRSFSHRRYKVPDQAGERQPPHRQSDPDEHCRDRLQERQLELPDQVLGADSIHAQGEDSRPVAVFVSQRDALE